MDWILVEKLGWSLEEVRGLSVQDFRNYLDYREGRHKADNSLFNKRPK